MREFSFRRYNMYALVSALGNLQYLLRQAIYKLFAHLFQTVIALAKGEKSFGYALGFSFVLFLSVNWGIVFIYSWLNWFDASLVLTKGYFYLLQSPVLVLLSYILWIHSAKIESKLGRIFLKAAIVFYVYVTMGSTIVSFGILPMPEGDDLKNAVVYPLKVGKNEVESLPLKYSQSLY